MIAPVIFEGMIRALFAFILLSAAFIINQRHIRSLFTTYALQSLCIVFLMLVLYTENNEQTFLFLAIATMVSKVIVIPWFMRKIHAKMNISRDVEFFKLTPITSMIASIFLVMISYQVVSKFSAELFENDTFKAGAVIGISLALIGMLILFSRKQMITKIIGYLTMENGVLLFSLFFAELPFLVEILIILDLVMLIMLTTILAFGIDSTIEKFHRKLNLVQRWFGEYKE